MSSDNVKFYQHFQAAVAGLEADIDKLATAPSRQEATDSIRVAISRLSNELADAAEYLPTYDQKSHTETIKGLTERLDAEVQKLAPKPRFQFKARAKKPAGEPKEDLRRNVGGFPASQQAHTPSPAPSETPAAEAQKDYNAEIKAIPSSSSSAVRRPSFSASKTITLSGHSNVHIVLPSSASAAMYGDLTHLEACVVDMSAAGPGSRPFDGLALKHMRRCVLVTGCVAGPVHVTGISDAVVVVASRQVRIHECRNVDFYLHCSSHPIIEDCSNVRFAPIPACYTPPWSETHENQWDQVDDFKWLKAEQSPNWGILPEEARLEEPFWSDVVAGKTDANADAILLKGGIKPAS